ncbi:glycosyltransferase [Candidatus Clostridium stratigraminis]|uniref:Glycosyltransferase n=1 Tax=Candidatus Clostridium stratigraminis TaxID=3381661 RepID=A0ABW8T595_9CLOT
MKICYLSDANSIHTKKWCDFFKRKGYDVHVISLNSGEIEGVSVHSCHIELAKVRNGSLYSKLNYITYVSKIKKLIAEIKPDILHAHYATSYGLLGALSGFKPYIISVWGSDVYDFPNGNILKKEILRYNLSKADIILSTSKVMAAETKKYTNKSIEVTPFGVNINVFKPAENKYKVKDKIIIGTVKTLEAKYGIEYLIRAFAIVNKKYKNLYLEIAGEGTQKEYLKNLCKELEIESYTKFLGFLSQDKVVDTLNRFDIAVFPSTLDSESFGVAAVEAQACGTPVIVSDVGGLPEATANGITSLVTKKKNVDELVNAMEKLISDTDLRIKMGENGRRFVIDNYNIEENFSKVDFIYKAIIK